MSICKVGPVRIYGSTRSRTHKVRNLIAGAFLLSSGPAFAWDIHATLMPLILEGAPREYQDIFQKSFPVPCAQDDQAAIATLIKELKLNPTTQVPPSTPSSAKAKCGPGTSITAREILAGTVVDDPDQGMDRNLPAEYDPKNERKWMGGSEGPSSQGFRHMFFGGWKLSQPVATLQVPLQAMGQAPERAGTIGNKAREWNQSNGGAWGVRVVGWALHYLQDLAQPFHSAQMLTPEMFPWGELFTWPLSTGVNQFIQESTRIVSNYHWAYEGYVRTQLREGAQSVFADCLTHPEKYSKLKLEVPIKDGRELALEVANASIGIASELGKAEIDFFGKKLKTREYNLSMNIGVLDYADYAIRPDLNDARKRLHAVTCEALANASVASLKFMRWALK